MNPKFHTAIRSTYQIDFYSNGKCFQTTVVNEFSFWNSMWFSVGSFMQQGSDITPRSVYILIFDCVKYISFIRYLARP